jgi:hypothetical protein
LRGQQYFLNPRNILQVLLQASVNLVISVGMTFVIIIDGLIPPDAAKKDGIKLVTQIVSNNVEAGQLQAGLVLKLVPKGSEVAVIEGAPGTTSSIDRVTGFTRAATPRRPETDSEPAGELGPSQSIRCCYKHFAEQSRCESHFCC